jgi:hypothetical protein
VVVSRCPSLFLRPVGADVGPTREELAAAERLGEPGLAQDHRPGRFRQGDEDAGDGVDEQVERSGDCGATTWARTTTRVSTEAMSSRDRGAAWS